MTPKNQNKNTRRKTTLQNLKKYIAKLGLLLIPVFLVLTILITAITNASTVASWQSTASTGCPTIANTQNSDLVSSGSFLYEIYQTSFYKFNPATYACTALTSFGWPAWGWPIALSNGPSNQIFALNGNYLNYYNTTNDSWIGSTYAFAKSTVAGNPPIAWASNGTTLGLTSTTDGTDIYVLFGNSTTFKKYSPSTNTWTNLSTLPASNYSGSAMVYYDGNIYALRGNNTTDFYKYNILGNSWSALTAVPGAVNGGGSLTLVGTKIFATIGGDKKDFYIYNPATDLWADSDPATTLENAPDFIWGGGATVTFGGNIYALQGNGTKNFWKYTVDTDGLTDGLQGAWNNGSTPTQIPDPVYNGGSLTTDGTYIYATVGLYSKIIYQYNPVGDTWTQLSNMPIGIGHWDSGNSLAESMGNLIYLNNNVWEISSYSDTNLALFRYSLAGGDLNTWPYYKTAPNIPSTSGAGASLTYPGISADDPTGDFLYALAGNNTKNFFRYSISSFAWLPWNRGILADGSLISQDTPESINENSGSIVQAGGKFYFWGNGNWRTGNVFLEYNPTTNAWKKLADAPYGTSGGGSGSALVAKGNYIYISVWGSIGRYDIANDTWMTNYNRGSDDNGRPYAQNPLYPNNSYPGTSTIEVNGKFYYIPGNTWPYFQEFDPVNNNWIWLASAPGGFGTGSYAVAAGTDIYFLQGDSTNFYKFDTLTNTWSTMTAFPGATSTGRAMNYPGAGDYIYAFNGNGTQGFYRYSISGNSWDALADTPAAVSNGSAITNYNNTDLYAFGGGATTRFWKYNIAGNTWDDTITQAPDTVNSGSGLVTTPGNIIYATRGGNTSDFWKYDPALDSWTAADTLPANTGDGWSNDYGKTLTYSPTLGDIFLEPGRATTGGEGYLHRFKLTPGPNQYKWIYQKKVPSAPGWSAGWGEALSYPGAGDLIYLLGAYGASGFYSFDTVNGASWNAAPSPSDGLGTTYAATGCNSMTKTGYLNRYIYITAVPNGANCDNPVFLRFDTLANSWVRLADPLGGAVMSGGASITLDSDNAKIYATAGGATKGFYVYDIASDTWSAAESTPVNVGSAAPTGFDGELEYYNNNVWLIPGGCASNGVSISNCGLIYRYDTATTSWPAINAVSNPNTEQNFLGGSDIASTTDGSKIFAILGNSLLPTDSNFWEYNISTDTWRSRASTIPTDFRSGGNLTTKDANTIFAMRGNNATTFLNYNIGTNTWATNLSQQFPVSVGSTSTDYNIGGLAYNSVANALFGLSGTNSTFYKLDLTSRAVITNINGGTNPTKAVPFPVVVESEDELGNPANVTQDTTVTLSVANGHGVLGGTISGVIPNGQSQVTLLGVTYSKAESGVTLTATDTSGSPTILATTSSSFTVNEPAPTITSIDPVSGPAAGGTAVTLTGTNFQRGFKRPVTISSMAMQVNYPVQVIIDTATLIADSKMNNDCSDIRFKDTDGTTDLNFWFDPESCNTPTTEAWVKVPTINMGATIIYLVYGDTGAVTQSNGSNVFDFFDDFTGNTIDTSIWDVTDTGGNISQNDKLIFTNGNSNWTTTGMASVSTFARQKEVRLKYQTTCENGGAYKDTTMVGWKNNNSSVDYPNMVHGLYFLKPNPGDSVFYTYENGGGTGPLDPFTCGQQYYIKIQSKPADFLLTGGANYYYSTDNQNWTLLRSANSPNDTPLKVGFTHYEGGIINIDNTFVKSYAASEPTTLIGAETTATSLTFDGTTATDITYINPTSITATTPAHAAGAVDVTLTNPDNQSVTSVGLFTYLNPVSAAESSLSSSPASVVADNVTTSTVTAILRNAVRVPVAGKTVTLAHTAGAGAPTITAVTCAGSITPAGISDTMGRACFTVKSATIANDTFQATDTTDGITVTQTATVNFTGSTTDAGTSTVTASVPSVVANDLSTSTITVTTKDSENNLLSGKVISLEKTSGSGAPTITPIACNPGDTAGTTDTNGQACFTVKSQTAAANVFTATDTTDSVTITQTATVTFTPGRPNGGTSTVIASRRNVPADNVTTSTITVTLKDVYNNLVPDKIVSISRFGETTRTAIPCSEGDIAGISNASGQACFTVRSSIPGTYVFRAIDDSDTILLAQTAPITFTSASAEAGNSTVVASPTSIPADNLTTSTVTVTLNDSDNNPVDGKTVTLTKTSGPGAPTITAIDCGLGSPVGVSDANGQACYTVKSSTRGTDVFTATDTTDSVTVTQTASIEFTCVTGTNEQCLNLQIGTSNSLTISNVPDTLNFSNIKISKIAQNIFSYNATGYNQNNQALISVEDLRNSSGFTLQVTASAFNNIIDPLKFIPLQNVYVVTSPSSTGGTVVSGIEYSTGSNGPQTIVAPLNTVADLLTPATFTTFGSVLGLNQVGTPVDLMQAGLDPSTGRIGRFSTNINYYALIPELQQTGNYQITLTFDISDNNGA